MSNLSHGMAVDQVEDLGRLLQAKSDQLAHLVAEVEGAVGRTLWEGPDATTFKQQWWPDHRTRLQGMAEQVRGFGQSALNNASEQRQASGGVTGAAAVAVAAVAAAGGAGHGSGAGSNPAVRGGASPTFSDGSTWTNDWRPDARGYDQWNFAYDGDGDKNLGNCTSFVAWRLNQLGQASHGDGFSFTNNHLDDGSGNRVEFGRLGNAYEWYANAGPEFRSTEPSVGSVLVWEAGDGKSSYGHVAVVRNVGADGTIVVEESSWDGYAYKQTTLAPGTYPKKFLDFLP